jgi:hypothetical protein
MGNPTPSVFLIGMPSPSARLKALPERIGLYPINGMQTRWASAVVFVGILTLFALGGCAMLESGQVSDRCAQLGAEAAVTKGAARQQLDLARRRCERWSE